MRTITSLTETKRYICFYFLCTWTNTYLKLFKKVKPYHTYIIGHYNPSIRIIDLVSHTTYVVCVNFIHKWRDLQFIARNLLRRNRRRNTFRIMFWCLTWGSNPGFSRVIVPILLKWIWMRISIRNYEHDSILLYFSKYLLLIST